MVPRDGVSGLFQPTKANEKDNDMKILLLEDDASIGMGLKYSLEKEDFEVEHFLTIKDTKDNWAKDTYDLCIIDINLPDGTGYEVCQFIKEKENIPVIFLTAIDAEVNVVTGLEMGADDYICKPFRVNELIARIKAVLRRYGHGTTQAYERIGNIRVNTGEAKVFVMNDDTGKEETIELTALEYRLLLTFINNRGQILTRNKLLQDMWDVDGDFVNDNTLTVYIKRLRDKIEKDPANPV